MILWVSSSIYVDQAFLTLVIGQRTIRSRNGRPISRPLRFVVHKHHYLTVEA